MKRYQYHSPGFGTNITLVYNNGLLAGVEIDPYTATEMTNAKAPFFISEQAFLTNCRTYNIKFTELAREISFEMFWKRYAYSPDKQPAIKAWNKLSHEDQLRAFDYIPRYDSQLKGSGLGKKYASTYLNSKIYIP